MYCGSSLLEKHRDAACAAVWLHGASREAALCDSFDKVLVQNIHCGSSKLAQPPPHVRVTYDLDGLYERSGLLARWNGKG